MGGPYNDNEDWAEQERGHRIGIFDLSGRKVNENSIGSGARRIYIINGKKVLK